MVSPRNPKIAQNRQKSCSSGLPESTLKKVTKNDVIWVPSRPQNIGFRAIGVSKIKKSPVSKNDLKITSKCLPCLMLLAPKITKNQKNTHSTNTNKLIQKIPKNEPKMDYFLARKRHQNHKNPRYRQNGPPGLQNEPPGFKNHQKITPGPPKSRKIMRIW